MKILNKLIDSFVGIGWFRMSLASSLFFVCHSITAVVCPADEIQSETVLTQAAELVGLADDVQNELKTHLTRVRGQGKMRGLNSQVRGRTAAMIRRIRRNPDYNTLPQDLEKLVELTGKLNLSFGELGLSPNQGREAPGIGVADRVSVRLARMSELAFSMRALKANGFPPLSKPRSKTIPAFNPAVDIAPGTSPALNGPTISTDRPVTLSSSEPEQPRVYSILIK